MPIDILMPALSPTMTEGKLAKWLVSEGDTVASGDVIAEIETDKATMEVEAVEEGTLAKILVAEGSEGVAVNSVIAQLLEEGESADDLASPAPKVTPKAAAQAAAETPTTAPAEAPKAAQTSVNDTPASAAVNRSGDGKRLFASPLARRIAADKGLDLSQIQGSGPHGRIIKADVENAKPVAVKPTAQAPKSVGMASAVLDPRPIADALGVEYDYVAANGMRQTIAKRLTESKQTVPHFYLTLDCNIDPLLALRAQVNQEADGAYKLSVNDFIIKAVALALRQVPAANASWTGDGIITYKHANISVAVAIEGGLMTPVVRAAETKSLVSISEEVKDLATRAKAGKLKPHEYQGGGFSISNLGMYGIKQFQAVINPPEGAILAIGAGEPRAVPVDGKIKLRTMMTVSMSCDHRVVDGAVGAEFLAAFKKIIEAPTRLLI